MPTINQLNSLDNPTASDLFPIYSQSNGDARKISLGNLAAWLETQLTVSDNKITQYGAPTTGQTVLVQDDQSSVWLVLTPAGTLSSLALKLPLQANCIDKQEILVNCTQIVSSLTFDANGSSVVGAPSSLAANGFFRLRYDAVMKTWYRVG